MTNVAFITEDKDIAHDMKSNRDDLTAVGAGEMADAIIAKIGQA